MTARICCILGGRGARSRAGRSPTSPCPPPNLFISLNGGREVNHFPQRRARAPLACLRAIRRAAQWRPSGLLRSPAHLPLSPSKLNHFPQRRALAPLACLRAIRRAAQSRRPVCFAARPTSPYPPPNLIISLNGGRELRSLAYAPFGARRSRAVRAWRPGTPHGNLLVGCRACE